MDIQVRERQSTTLSGGDAPKGGSGKGLSPEKLKIIVAAALLVVAGLVSAWQFGLFGSGNQYRDSNTTPLGVTPEEEERMWEEAQQERDRVHPPGRTPPPSGS